MIVGLCGGYQMLGQRVADPLGIEGAPAEVEVLGLLDVETRLSPAKILRRASGTALGAPVTGSEIHMGETHGPGTGRAFAEIGSAHVLTPVTNAHLVCRLRLIKK